MHSAFGVDHGISKSFVPGKGFKAASKLDSTERHIVRNKAQGNRAVMRQVGGRLKNSPSARGQKIYPGIETKKGVLKQVVAHRTKMPQGAPGTKIEGYSQPDGRGGGRITVAQDADFTMTHRHEMAHITPKRNPHRFFERTADPKRLGKEEGRADFTAYRGKTPGNYPGNKDFQSGYNEVQGKMAGAKKKKS